MKQYLKTILISVIGVLFILNISMPKSLAAQDLVDIENSYAKDAIQNLVDAGILNGEGDGRFNPTGKISRQDFAIIMAKALNLDTTEAPGTATFSDVPATHYSYAWVEAAAQAGLFNGLGDGRFGLGNSLSRQDMAVVFVRALGFEDANSNLPLNFSDASNISSYARDAVAQAAALGLMTGNSNNTFNPLGAAQRQEVAIVAKRFIDNKDDWMNQKDGDSDDSDKPDDAGQPDDSGQPNDSDQPGSEEPPYNEDPIEGPPNEGDPIENPPNKGNDEE